MYRVRARSPSRADERIYVAARHGRFLMAVVVLSRFLWIECAFECRHFYGVCHYTSCLELAWTGEHGSFGAKCTSGLARSTPFKSKIKKEVVWYFL